MRNRSSGVTVPFCLRGERALGVRVFLAFEVVPVFLLEVFFVFFVVWAIVQASWNPLHMSVDTRL